MNTMLMLMPMFAAISSNKLVNAGVWAFIIAIVCALLIFLVNYWEIKLPYSKWAKGIIITIGVLLFINILLGLAGHPIFT